MNSSPEAHSIMQIVYTKWTQRERRTNSKLPNVIACISRGFDIKMGRKSRSSGVVKGTVSVPRWWMILSCYQGMADKYSNVIMRGLGNNWVFWTDFTHRFGLIKAFGYREQSWARSYICLNSKRTSTPFALFRLMVFWAIE